MIKLITSLTAGVSYYGAGNDYPPSTGYGTYNYNSNDLYNEPRYTPPPNYSRTPPPDYTNEDPTTPQLNQTPPQNNQTTPQNSPRTRQIDERTPQSNEHSHQNNNPATLDVRNNSTVGNDMSSNQVQTQTIEPNLNRTESVPSGSQSSLLTEQSSGFWRGFLRRTRGTSRQSNDILSATQ